MNKWDTYNVEKMQSMFYGASEFKSRNNIKCEKIRIFTNDVIYVSNVS
nr:BspA family leucine-rich repeat surface protein [Mycoplasmopsis bovis]